MAIDKEDWKMGCSEEDPPKGCNIGCLALMVACIAIDALAAWAVWQVAQGMSWLISLMAYA